MIVQSTETLSTNPVRKQNSAFAIAMMLLSHSDKAVSDMEVVA